MNSTPENARSLSLLSTWKNSLNLQSFVILILMTVLYFRVALPPISSGKANSSTSSSIYTGFEPAVVTPYMFPKHAFEITKHIHALHDRLASISGRDSKRGYNELDIFLDSIVVIQRELGYISSNLSHLITGYHDLRYQYCKHNSSAAQALKVLEPKGLRRRAIIGGYETWAYIGLNFTKMYWEPWVEAMKIAEVARSGLADLEDEMSRLEKIEQVVSETAWDLSRLAFVVDEGVTEGNFYKHAVEARDILMRARHLWGGALPWVWSSA